MMEYCALFEWLSGVHASACRGAWSGGNLASANDSVPFSGVDDVSLTAETPDPAADGKIWIMAPIGGSGGNDLKLQIPVGDSQPITLSASNLAGETTLSKEGQEISLTGSGNETTDSHLELHIGTNTALSKPIGIKAMKARTVKVTLTPVGRPAKINGQDTVLYPKQVPNKERLSRYLNRVFGLQLNANIELTYAEQKELDFSTIGLEGLNLDPDVSIDNDIQTHIPKVGDGGLDVFPGRSTTDEEDAFAEIRDPQADINIYYVGGTSIIRGWTVKDQKLKLTLANGYANVDSREAWVMDSSMDAPLIREPYTPEDLERHARLMMLTIAHESGHLIAGAGHPDQGGGGAPLGGKSHIDQILCRERLMRSYVSKDKNLFATRLAKGEWDKAEEWFKKRPNGDR